MLNLKQKKVALKIKGNTIVSASPGTGKTKTLVARAQHKLESIPKHKSLALITYTNAGADEISSRLISDVDNVFIGTIHRFCLEFILRPFGWIYQWKKSKIVTYDELKEFLGINSELDLGHSPIDELNKIKCSLDGDIDKSVEWEHPDSLNYVADLYYDFLDSKNAIDFNEILYRSYKIVSGNKFVVNSLANKFYEISIDEFQDTNIFQYEILKLINSVSSCTFFIVGDEKQKIYRFAGAINNAFDKASIDFLSTVEDLDVTYRSTSNVIKAYSCLFDNHPELENESKYKNCNFPIIINETNNNTNNEYIDNCIHDVLTNRDIPITEIAVLTNSWRDAFNISRYLRQKYNVVGLGALPHRKVNSSSFQIVNSISRFMFSPSIKHLRVIRRNIEFHALENNIALSNSNLSLACNSIVSNVQRFDLSATLLDGLEELKQLFNQTFFIYHSDFDELFDLINSEEAENWTIEKYFKTLSGIDGLTVNTIHQSKGLEYEVVLLNGVSEGAIPYQRWDQATRSRHPLTNNNLIDGRAKLYVGISRAKSFLFIVHNWRPSMFISKLEAIIN